MADRGKIQRSSRVSRKDRAYTPEEAVELAKKTATAKFDETLELHLKMVSTPKCTQQVRGAALYRTVWVKDCILVFAQGEAEK